VAAGSAEGLPKVDVTVSLEVRDKDKDPFGDKLALSEGDVDREALAEARPVAGRVSAGTEAWDMLPETRFEALLEAEMSALKLAVRVKES